jgi:hypothetical protein
MEQRTLQCAHAHCTVNCFMIAVMMLYIISDEIIPEGTIPTIWSYPPMLSFRSISPQVFVPCYQPVTTWNDNMR